MRDLKDDLPIVDDVALIVRVDELKTLVDLAQAAIELVRRKLHRCVKTQDVWFLDVELDHGEENLSQSAFPAMLAPRLQGLAAIG